MVKVRIGLGALSLLVAALFCLNVPSVLGQTPMIVPTWRYDLTHTGQNTIETVLTPANVNEASFSMLFFVAVDTTAYRDTSGTLVHKNLQGFLAKGPNSSCNVTVTRVKKGFSYQ